MALLTWILGTAPFLAMIIAKFIDVGITIVSKAAMTNGLSNYVFVVYTNSLVTVVILPFAIFRSTAQTCAFTGLKYSSPTLAAAIVNLIPLVTFFLAIMMRMEKLDLRSSPGLGVLGALIATLYQGAPILMSSYPAEFLGLHSQQSNWAFGGLLMAANSVLIAIWYISLTGLVMEFPENETIILISGFFRTIITGIFCLFMETNLSVWKLTADIDIIAILFTAIAGEIINILIRAWCLKDKGITYTVMFNPLGIVISVVMAAVFLGETLHTGSLLGGIVVTLGFYTVMWGKVKEQGMILNCGADVPESCSVEAPLLLNHHDDEV